VWMSSSDTERSARQFCDSARHVRSHAPQRLLAAVVLLEIDPVEHALRDRPYAAKEIERYAAGRRIADGDRTERCLQMRRIDVADHRLLGFVVAVQEVDVPEPVMASQSKLTVDRA